MTNYLKIIVTFRRIYYGKRRRNKSVLNNNQWKVWSLENQLEFGTKNLEQTQKIEVVSIYQNKCGLLKDLPDNICRAEVFSSFIIERIVNEVNFLVT